MKPYLDTRASGVQWLGDIPAHWNTQKLRNITDMRVSNVDKLTIQDEIPIRLCNYVDVYKHERITESLPFMRASATPDEICQFRVAVGDVLITKDSEAWNDIGVPALVEYAAPDLLCGYHLAMLRPRALMSGAYLFRALQCQLVAYQFHVKANGVTRFGLTHGAIKSVIVPLPPLDEQQAIVRYLDAIDRRVRRYIRAKQRLLALLREQKQAIIHQAVTRGLDASALLKPSGVAWLGEVPAHWEQTRLKFVAEVQTGLTLGKHHTTDDLVERPYLRVANVQSGFLDLTTITTIRIPEREAKSCELRPGDVLMTEGGDIDKLGRGYIWQGEIPGCLHQNHVFAVRVDISRLLPEFLVALMSSMHGRSYFQLTAKQTTNLASTNATTLKAFPLILPPVDEQAAILGGVEWEIKALDSIIADTNRKIALIQEYRIRLIADVVTGKVDVRAAAVALPAEVGEEETWAAGEVEEESEEVGEEELQRMETGNG